MTAKTLGQLQLSAVKTAKWRGHEMSAFTSLTERSAVATCFRCGMELAVDTKPPPNGIDIGGEAVALNCVPR